MTTIAITGARGYIGSALTEALGAAGHHILSLVRSPKCDTELYFQLGDAKLPSLRGVDILIHCAWDLSASKWADIVRKNVEGSKMLFEHAQRERVQTIIFISSMAAFSGCSSLYGRSKLLVEELVTQRKGIVIRPGTVYGGTGGGIVAAMSGLIRKFHCAPLIGGGSHTLYTVHIEDLCNFVSKIISNTQGAKGKVLVAAHSQPITLKAFFQEIAAQIGIKPILIPVPASFIFIPLKLLELVGIKPPLRSDSVTSIVQGAGKEMSIAGEGFSELFRPLPRGNKI